MIRKNNNYIQNAPYSKFKIGNCFLQNNKILVLKLKKKNNIFQLIIRIINYLLNT